MIVTLDPELEIALSTQARQRGIEPETLALDVLRKQFLPIEPRDEWERRLFGAAMDCGVSVADTALSSEGLYE